VVYLPPWKIWSSQIGSSSQLLGKIKHVWNQQPEYIQQKSVCLEIDCVLKRKEMFLLVYKNVFSKVSAKIWGVQTIGSNQIWMVPLEIEILESFSHSPESLDSARNSKRVIKRSCMMGLRRPRLMMVNHDHTFVVMDMPLSMPMIWETNAWQRDESWWLWHSQICSMIFPGRWRMVLRWDTDQLSFSEIGSPIKPPTWKIHKLQDWYTNIHKSLVS